MSLTGKTTRLKKIEKNSLTWYGMKCIHKNKYNSEVSGHNALQSQAYNRHVSRLVIFNPIKEPSINHLQSCFNFQPLEITLTCQYNVDLLHSTFI